MAQPSIWSTSNPHSRISFRRPTPPKSKCKTWRPCWNAPAAACCPPSTKTWTARKRSAGRRNWRCWAGNSVARASACSGELQFAVLSAEACATGHSDHDAIQPKDSFDRDKLRDGHRLHGWGAIPPEAHEGALLPGSIVMQQVRHIARRVVAEPPIDIHYPDLMEHAQCIACRLPLIIYNRGQQIRANRRRLRPADLEQARVYVPLDRVAKHVRQQEQALFRTYRAIDVNLRPVQVPGQRVGNVARHHADAIEMLQVLLYPATVFGKRYHAR